MVMGDFVQEVDVVVVGSGPGGYAATFRAADLGLEVAMVDQGPRPGGVCLFRGCIPSKTLLYLSQLLYDTGRAAKMGLTFAVPRIDLDVMRSWKDKVIDRLSGGLETLGQKRGVQFVQARAAFEDSNLIRLQGAEISQFRFRHAILATGSSPRPLPGVEFSPGGRVINSTGALELVDIPETMLVAGGGFVGLELGSVYAALGTRVTLVEAGDRLIASADPDLARPLIRRVIKEMTVHTGTRVIAVDEDADGVNVVLEGAKIGRSEQRFDRVLVAIGRTPNTRDIGLESTKVQVDARGFVAVDEQQRTADPFIFAAGDVTGGAMLAHKAMREGKVAAEVIAGEPSAFDVRAMLAVVSHRPAACLGRAHRAGGGRAGNPGQGRPFSVGRFGPRGDHGRA